MSIYLSSGGTKANHIHRLVRIKPDTEGSIFRCLDCNAHLKRINGVFVPHELTQCELTNSWYHGRSTAKGGQWQEQYTCPDCGRQGKFLRNYLGQRRVYCDGRAFHKLNKL